MFLFNSGNEIITVLNESLSLTDVDTIAASLGTSNLTSNCSLYKAYASQLSRITKVKPIVASLNSQITELLVRNLLVNDNSNVLIFCTMKLIQIAIRQTAVVFYTYLLYLVMLRTQIFEIELNFC